MYDILNSATTTCDNHLMILINHHDNKNKQIVLNFVDIRDYLKIKTASMLSYIAMSTSHIVCLHVSTYISDLSQFYYLSSSRVYLSKTRYASGMNKKAYMNNLIMWV